MNILEAHKFFYRRGGAETVFFETIDGLRSRGHEVAEFSMQHPKNLPSAYSAYFAPNLPELSEPQNLGNSLKTFGRLFSSREVEQKLKALVLATEPQIAHLHNVYHHLSASIFTTLKKMKVPIVLTVHDVQPMCPNHRMVRGTDDTLCERCHRHKYYNCVRYRCINNSHASSLAGALESYYYYLRNIWHLVDMFICPSEFIMDKLSDWGFPREKMRLVRNPYRPPASPPPLGNKIVYLGRLHLEKGIRVFLEAAKYLRDFEIVIAGTGPDEDWVDKFISQHGLTNIKRLGWVGGEEWKMVMAEAKVVAVPSVFYEICSLTILEAMGHARLVVASDRGGNRELIADGKSGFLVAPENPEELSEALKLAASFPDQQAGKISAAAYSSVLENHNREDYLDELEKIYREVITK